MDHMLTSAKAYAGLVGAAATALLGTLGSDSPLFDWLTGIAAVSTAIAVYTIPNAVADPEALDYEETEPGETSDAEEILKKANRSTTSNPRH